MLVALVATLDFDVRNLLRAYMSNFVDPDVLKSEDDITAISYQDRSKQVNDDELGVGTTTRLLLCGELEDEVVGTHIETRFFEHVREFYETSVAKILTKFPFKFQIARFRNLLFWIPVISLPVLE